MDGRSAGDPPASLDLVVVGAGIVGLATARELALRHPGRTVTVIDAEDRIAAHQTSHNSGVVHAGIYYRPGSLKARLCVAGAAEMARYCEERGLPYERCGKVIVAVDRSELPALDELERRGRANRVPGLRRIDGRELERIEPHARGLAALHSPATGIADFAAVARTLADDLREAGGAVVLGRRVTGIERRAHGVRLHHPEGALEARNVIVCAGAWSDRLARLAGENAAPRIVPFRGAYLRLRGDARGLVRSLIYPVPDPELPFLGVHLTKHISGDVLIGPTALLAGARDAYELRRIRGRDVLDTLTWPGSWRMFRRFWRTGVTELRHAASRRALVAAAARFIPDLRPDHVEPAFAGVRAQALERDGELVDDFVISTQPGLMHVRNAPSPAATSAFAIARMIADDAERAFDLSISAQRAAGSLRSASG